MQKVWNRLSLSTKHIMVIVKDQGPISWLCLLPNSALTITIPRLRASAEFLPCCKRRIPSNAEYARAEAKIRRLPVKYACRKHGIPCFRKRRFYAYGKQSHEIGPIHLTWCMPTFCQSMNWETFGTLGGSRLTR